MNITLSNPRNHQISSGVSWSANGLVFHGSRLIEELRFEISSQFATISSQEGYYGVSKRSVIDGVQKRLDLNSSEKLREKLGRYFDLLLDFGDLGKLPGVKGYIPRESRITMILKQWGRHAGGLPSAHNECADDSHVVSLDDTIGNLVRIQDSCISIPDSWEVKETVQWEKNQCQSSRERILGSLKTATLLPYAQLEYYDSEQPLRRSRRECWRSGYLGQGITIARSISSCPRQYYLCQMDGFYPIGNSLSRDDAIFYLLWMDWNKSRKMHCHLEQCGGEIIIRIPKYFPSAWEYAFKTASLDYEDIQSCLELRCKQEPFSLIQTLLQQSCGKIIWQKT